MVPHDLDRTALIILVYVREEKDLTLLLSIHTRYRPSGPFPPSRQLRACSAVIRRSSKGFQNLGSLVVIPSREVSYTLSGARGEFRREEIL